MKPTACSHRRESCCVVEHTCSHCFVSLVESKLATCGVHVWIPTQGEVSTAHQTALFRSNPFPVPQLKFGRMPLGLVPHISPAFHCDVRRSSCQMLHTTAATVVDRCDLFWLLPRVKFHPKENESTWYRQGRHTSANIHTKKNAKAPRSTHGLHTECKWTAVLCGGTHLWPQKPKKLTKTQKNSTFDQIYKVDEHYKSDDLSVWRFLWIQTTNQAFKEKNEKVSLTSPFLTPAARCGECRFNNP